MRDLERQEKLNELVTRLQKASKMVRNFNKTTLARAGMTTHQAKDFLSDLLWDAACEIDFMNSD